MRRENQHPDQIARQIQQRCNALDISVTRLCRDAGVSRNWFERLKKRTPAPIESYLRLEKLLEELEAATNTNPNYQQP